MHKKKQMIIFVLIKFNKLKLRKMNIKGAVKVIEKTESFGAKNFLKRNLVVETDEQYPQLILIEFVQDNTKLLDKYKVGDKVDVSINLRGREWINPEGITKYFNSIQGWRIQNEEQATPPQDATPPPGITPSQPKTANGLGQEDDLPFNKI